MLLNEAFFNIYEELSELNEAKADTQRLVDFAGEDLANRFLAIKNRLKAPENDLYYWIKSKTPADLEAAVISIENSKSNTQLKKDTADEGAKLIAETKHWKIYHITTFEASQKYGRDTKWCITGAIGGGDRYWKQYIDAGIEFYFLITKDAYNPRGTDSKFAIAVYTKEFERNVEIYNQQDTRVHAEDIPYSDEIMIPNVDITKSFYYCDICGEHVASRDDLIEFVTDDGTLCCCKECFDDQNFFVCSDCKKSSYKACMLDDGKGGVYCLDCRDKHNKSTFEGVSYEITCYEGSPSIHITGFAYSAEGLVSALTRHLEFIADRDDTTLLIISQVTGEILFDEQESLATLIKKLQDTMETTDFYWESDVEDIAFAN
jgi:hypothetical protein